MRNSKALKNGVKRQGNSATKNEGGLTVFETALFGIASQVHGSCELIDMTERIMDGRELPPQGAAEYFGGGVARDSAASGFTLTRFGLELLRDYSWIVVGNRKTINKFLVGGEFTNDASGYWRYARIYAAELKYELAKQVTESKYIIPGLISGCEMVENGWTLIGEHGVSLVKNYYGQAMDASALVGKEMGNIAGTQIYGSTQEQVQMTREVYQSDNPLTVVGRTLGGWVGTALYD